MIKLVRNYEWVVKRMKVKVFEPSFESKRRERAFLFSGRKSPYVSLTLEELKEKLRNLRRKAVGRLFELKGRFVEKAKALGFKVCEAETAQEAASYIKDKAQGIKVLSLNKSNVVINELRRKLHELGFSTYVRYFGEFQNFDPQSFRKQLEDYWVLPGLHQKGIFETFDMREELELPRKNGLREYGAVLGVNVVASQEGEVLFLEHMSNIAKDLKEAKKLFIVIPLEKFTENEEEAVFQTKMIGIFGLESLLLDLGPKEEEVFDFERLPSSEGEQEVHLILFDNKRSGLLGSPYEELLLCIDCRACARQCPIGKHLMVQKGMVYSPKNYLLGFLLGFGGVFDTCLHCGRCEVECPVDINIPYLVWRAQIDFYSKKGRGFKKRLLDNPELMAKLGTSFASLANFALKFRPVRKLMRYFVGIHEDAPLPTFPKETFRDWLKKRGEEWSRR